MSLHDVCGDHKSGAGLVAPPELKQPQKLGWPASDC